MKNLFKVSALVLGLVASVSANANLVTNGSFEDNPIASGTWKVVNLTGWTGSGAYNNPTGTELRNNVAGTASDGVNFVELDGQNNGWISQDITTDVGQKYAFSFDYADRVGTSPATNGLLASFDGNLYTLGSVGSAWTTYTGSFVASSPLTTISFMALGTSDSYGTSLDNVNVSPVPEPEEWAMMMLGLPLMGFVARRRKAA